MQTEFTCGIYTATFNSIGAPKWFVKLNDHVLALIDDNGKLIHFTNHKYLSQDDLLEIAVLMNNIKRQYKALQNQPI